MFKAMLTKNLILRLAQFFYFVFHRSCLVKVTHAWDWAWLFFWKLEKEALENFRMDSALSTNTQRIGFAIDTATFDIYFSYVILTAKCRQSPRFD